MTKPKHEHENELETVWAGATLAKEEAVKARNRANHAVAVVHVAQEALAAAHAKAAEAHLHAEAAEKMAKDEAAKARQALEKGLGIVAEDAKSVPPVLPAPVVPS